MRPRLSKLTRDLDDAVRGFHVARLSDDYAYLFLDGLSLRVRRPAGRKRVQMLVAYRGRRDGTRHLLAFLRCQGESQADWEGLLGDLYRRGLEGKQLRLIRHRWLSRLSGGDSHFQRFNLEWENPRPQPIYTRGLTHHWHTGNGASLRR